jgi:hypothetical protein
MSGFERWSKARCARIIAFNDIAEDRLIRVGAGIPPRNVRDAPPPSLSALPTYGKKRQRFRDPQPKPKIG